MNSPQILNAIGVGSHFVAVEPSPASDQVFKFFKPQKMDWPGNGMLPNIWNPMLIRQQVRRIRQRFFIRRKLNELLSVSDSPRKDVIDKILIPSVVKTDLNLTYRGPDGTLSQHKGWGIIQDRAEIFDNSTPLDSFDWDLIADSQIMLWRVGIGLGAPAETWGPKNWARSAKGSVQLGDISHLTTNRADVLPMLDASQMVRRRTNIDRHQPDSCKHLAGSYIEYLSKKLNAENLAEEWCADL